MAIISHSSESVLIFHSSERTLIKHSSESKAKRFRYLIKNRFNYEAVFLFNFVKNKFIMCNENINNIASFDFSQIVDEINWFNNSSNPILTENNKLVLRPDTTISMFSRGLGSIDITNNRLRYKLNFEIFRPTTTGVDTVNFIIQIWNGFNLIGESTVYVDNISVGQIVKYSLDRTYEYDQLTGNVSIKIKTPQGYQNEIRLTKLDVWDFNFCEENVRTYFVFDEFFQNAITAQSAGLRLLKYKVDDVETLTPAFFAHNTVNLGGNPIAQWKYATAEIDGGNRIAATSNQNTFNPFVDEFGLIFDTINSFHGEKPIGTIGSQNFGSGIMNIGFEKPEIYNGLLQRKKGAFFIDIDYTKNLFIECDVVVNQTSSQLFTNPTSFRKYFIIWDAEKCQKQFYFINQIGQNQQPQDQLTNGFLTGITPETKEDTSITCNGSLNFNGAAGSYSFEINFGTDIGMAGIAYNASHIPDKFEISWNGQTVSTGYVGCNEYNQDLINAGVPMSQINTTPHPGNGAGQLLFNKNSAYPTNAIVTVTGVIGNTGWNFSGICPFISNFTEISWNDTNTTEDRTGNDTNETIYNGGVFFPVTNEVWQKNINGAGWVDDSQVVNVTGTFNLVAGINEFRLKAMVGSNAVYSNKLKYTRSNITEPQSGGISFPIHNATELNICIARLSDGGSPITECGVIYNQNTPPTLLDNKIIYDNNLSNECKIFTRPIAGVLYYFTVYYTNSVGTSFIDYPNKI